MKPNPNGKLRRTALYTLVVILLLSVAVDAHSNADAKSAPCPGDTLYRTMAAHLKLAPQHKELSIGAFLDQWAINDLNALIHKFGRADVLRAIELFPHSRLEELLEAQGDDFFMLAIHSAVSARHYISILDSRFGIDPHWLANSMKHTRGRFTGALIIFETIDRGPFDTITRIFADALPAEVFLESFYNDPYLLASAMRIFAQRDPQGIELKSFLAYFPDNHTRAELFINDLPGLVVAFSTIQEIKSGQKVLWVKEFLDISDHQLADLIRRKPVDLAYVLHGGYRIGISNYKKIIEGIGREHFRTALVDHTAWLATFLTGLEKVTILSSNADFGEIDAAKRSIQKHQPFLLEYGSHAGSNFQQVTALFENLPEASIFLNSEDKAIGARAYLLGMLAIYQNILHSHMPDAMLSRSQFELLKWQILCSTRFSKNLDNMMSNFEVGRRMVEDNGMQTILLFLAHELAHQIYAISGFDAPLLSAASIHECSADIAARCIAQVLGYDSGMEEYGDKIIGRDDYSGDGDIAESDLIGHGIPHKIGRTQLGYIMKAFRNNRLDLDWETLFTVNLAVLRNKTKMKHLAYVRHLIAGYTYTSSNSSVSDATLQRFIGRCQRTYETLSQAKNAQLADTPAVEKMIITAQALMLRAATP